MDDPDEYRKFAKTCMEMVPRINPEYRPLLLSIAEAWLTLARAVEAGREQQITTH